MSVRKAEGNISMTILEKAAYIKGLADGLKPDQEKPEGKLISELIALVGDMAEELSEMKGDANELRDYVEELDDDLADVEEYLWDDEDDEDEDDDEEDISYTDEIVCPSCGETICFDEDADLSNLVCPNCGERLSCSQDCSQCEEEDCDLKKD